MIERLHLSPRHCEEIEALLHKHLPDVEVWAYGSRVNGRSHDGSDLDLVLRGPKLAEIDTSRIVDFIEALQDSTIPFLVEARDWARLPESFHREIEREHVVLVAPSDESFKGRYSGVMGEWLDIPFSHAFLINPPTHLERGKTYPFIDMATIDAGCRSIFSSKQREFRGGGSRFKSGDTLMARITPCLENGKIARYRAPDMAGTAHGSTEFIVIRGCPAITDNEFAYYITQSEEVRSYAIGQMTGPSGRQRVPTESLDHLMVSVPPLPEQRAIAHILGTLDDKIELNRRMNETLEAMARALFKSWFVDFDPVRAKMAGRDTGLPQHLADLFPDRLVESELGPIPEGWEVGAIEDLAEVSSGKRPGVRYEEASDLAQVPLWGGNGPMAFVPEPLVEYPILLTGRVGTLGSIFRIISPCWPSDNTLIFIVKDKRAFEFLFFQLKCIDFTSLNRGSTQPLVTQTNLKAQIVLLPPVNVLERFHAFTKTLYARLDKSESESRTLATLRDTLLPKLVSGEVRVGISRMPLG